MIRRARVVLAVQLVLGLAVLALAGIGYAGERDELVVVAVLIVAVVGLSQALPAVVAMLLLRRGRTRAGLRVSGVAAFVPGVMTVFLTVSNNPQPEGIAVALAGALLAALGFHQLLVRSRLAR